MAVYGGKQPSSWRAVASSAAVLLASISRLPLAATHDIKQHILRVFAHTDCLATGRVSGDVSGEEFFEIITNACNEQLDKLPAELHTYAQKQGFLQELSLGAHADDEGVLQDKFIPYLKNRFGKTIILRNVCKKRATKG